MAESQLGEALPENESLQLVAFLESLTGTLPTTYVPDPCRRRIIPCVSKVRIASRKVARAPAALSTPTTVVSLPTLWITVCKHYQIAKHLIDALGIVRHN